MSFTAFLPLPVCVCLLITSAGLFFVERRAIEKKKGYLIDLLAVGRSPQRAFGGQSTPIVLITFIIEQNHLLREIEMNVRYVTSRDLS